MHCIAYPGKDGILHTWHGEAIGSWKATSSWPIRSWVGSKMYQIEARIGDVIYTGRGFGEGMIFKGKRKASLGSPTARDEGILQEYLTRKLSKWT